MNNARTESDQALSQHDAQTGPQTGLQPQSQIEAAIAQQLGTFARFGVKLGLGSTRQLLDCLGNPQAQVPVIHVAGTNGKGSVCAYLSSILSQAGYRVGRYTSPHLVSWTERICINGSPIQPQALLDQVQYIQQTIQAHQVDTTQFEVITAAAWRYFAQEAVDIAIIEVGLGGRLDATNVCDRPLVSVITSISRDHWQRLGPTLADIAGEKAGILKPQCPAVIGPLPDDAQGVFTRQSQVLDCPTQWIQPAQPQPNGALRYCSPTAQRDVEYTTPLLGAHQRTNSALAIAAIHCLQDQGWAIAQDHILTGLAQAQWAGRLQWLPWRDQNILVDGAHNEASAAALRRFVDTCTQPIHWVMGMLSTKDHDAVFGHLLRPGDRLTLVPVPGHQTADPQQLAQTARRHCSDLAACHCMTDVIEALHAACAEVNAIAPTSAPRVTAPSPMPGSAQGHAPAQTVVLCGSLYLIGHLFQRLQKIH